MTAKKAVKSAVVVVQKPEPATEHDIKVQSLIMAAIDKAVPIDVLERLLAMREKVQKEQAELEFRAAISAFQGDVPVIVKRKEVHDKSGKLRYRYAPIEDIVRQVQPYLKANGLSYDIDTEQVGQGIAVTVTVSHVAGHQKITKFTAPIQADAYMTDPQKWAAAFTFAKRYAFCNGFGILTGEEDNDAVICDDTAHGETPERMAEAVALIRTAVDLVDLEKRAVGLAKQGFSEAQRKSLREEYIKSRNGMEGNHA